MSHNLVSLRFTGTAPSLVGPIHTSLWNDNFDEAVEKEDVAVASYLEMAFLGHGSLQPSETGDINMLEPPSV